MNNDRTKPRVHRQVRSFVKREGRLTPGQEKAINTGWPIFGLNLDHPLDLTAVFGNNNPVTLEIGFGNGESLVQMAEQSPDRNFIGIEVHRPGVGHLLRAVLEKNLQNLRVFDTDAVEVLKQVIPDHGLDCVQLFFPDPWHKKRHHKRRILQADFLNLLQQKIKTGGTFHAATDWQAYAEHMLETLEQHPGFKNTGKGYLQRPDHRPITKFEQRGLRLGHGVWDLIFQRI